MGRIRKVLCCCFNTKSRKIPIETSQVGPPVGASAPAAGVAQQQMQLNPAETKADEMIEKETIALLRAGPLPLPPKEFILKLGDALDAACERPAYRELVNNVSAGNLEVAKEQAKKIASTAYHSIAPASRVGSDPSSGRPDGLSAPPFLPSMTGGPGGLDPQTMAAATAAAQAAGLPPAFGLLAASAMMGGRMPPPPAASGSAPQIEEVPQQEAAQRIEEVHPPRVEEVLEAEESRSKAAEPDSRMRDTKSEKVELNGMNEVEIGSSEIGATSVPPSPFLEAKVDVDEDDKEGGTSASLTGGTSQWDSASEDDSEGERIAVAVRSVIEDLGGTANC